MKAISTAAEFADLIDAPDINTRKIASQVFAPEEVWLEIVKLYPDLRWAVAQNKNVPLSILMHLAHDGDPRARTMVARKRKLTPAIIEELARDVDSGVRLAVVFHPKCPRSVLERLAADDWAEVSQKARQRLQAS
jgi:hypothetical protein